MYNHSIEAVLRRNIVIFVEQGVISKIKGFWKFYISIDFGKFAVRVESFETYYQNRRRLN